MPGYTITRGLGGNASNLIARGFSIGAEALRIIRAGRSKASRVIKDLIHDVKISAMLLEANGKLLASPIINKVRKKFSEKEEDKITIKIVPKKLIVRESNDIKITIKNVKVRK